MHSCPAQAMRHFRQCSTPVLSCHISRVCHNASRHHFTRGIPYAPVGTIQDFTASPRHVALPELQRQQDLHHGRAPTGLYNGPTITAATGVRPLFARGNAASPQTTATGEAGGHVKKGDPARRKPRSSFAEQVMPSASSSMGYQQDIRTDPRYADEPEHIRAARQSILAMQSDSAGEAIRGVVPPPPERDPAYDAQYSSYSPPRVQLGDAWWALLASFLLALALMVRYGH